ncbi:transcription factor [Panus rudis PR-1116 ss-1]|nr:transcription factor [Panus rudis PR-1116 ss-1]
MQAASKVPGQQAPVKIYNAVYSSVQVYECMVRGIAVMRRRADSYVNATQILKVAGVDKGRRTKILEKEILPGPHEIVQGGYGKYQGTWIPLERGRDIATQYGVAPLLAPLFDFVPNPNSLGGLPSGMPTTASPRPLSAASSFSSLGASSNLVAPGLAPPPILPGSALRLLNQGRAQGLFTPSTSSSTAARPFGYASPGPHYNGTYPSSPFSSMPGISPTPPPSNGQSSLKRTRSDTDMNEPSAMVTQPSQSFPTLAASPDIQMLDGSRPPSATTVNTQPDGTDNPSPTKRARTDPDSLQGGGATVPHSPALQLQNAQPPSQPRYDFPSETNGYLRAHSLQTNGKTPLQQSEAYAARFASKPLLPQGIEPEAPARDTRRTAVVTAISLRDDPTVVLDLLREIPPDNPGTQSTVDLVLDEHGHTALHIAASLARHQTVEALIANGADVHRGNYNGETPLIRAVISTHNADTQSFPTLLSALNASIRTIDTSRKTVVHHIVASAGVKGRSLTARYYLDQLFYWIAQNQEGEFRSLVDLQDEHGDTALNVAARVGNRNLVRALLDVGANRILPNKLGLRPGDFGVEPEEFAGGPRADDRISSLRSGPSAPVQQSQEVIAQIQNILQEVTTEFAAEAKSKQDSLDVIKSQVRAATRELAQSRKQLQQCHQTIEELDLIHQRTRNLEKALKDEDNFDWSVKPSSSSSEPSSSQKQQQQAQEDGEAGSSSQPTAQTNGTSFPSSSTQDESSVSAVGGMDIPFTLDPDPVIPMTDTPESLIRMRRMKLWHEKMERLMEERMKSLKGASAEKEFQCKKIVALCTGVPIGEIENMLDNLVVAVESEASVIDISRVSGFMQKVRNGVI